MATAIARLAVKTTGKGFPLVMLHGLGSSTEEFRYNTDSLSKHFQLVLVDLPGHGQSRPLSGDFSIPDVAREIIRCLDEEGCLQYHLLGVSLGGAVALQMSLEAREKISRLVVVNSAPDYRLTRCYLLVQYITRLIFLGTCGMDTIAGIVSKHLFPDEDQQDLRRLAFETIRKTDKATYRKAMKGLVQWSVADRLNEIEAPLLYLISEHEPFAGRFIDVIQQKVPVSNIDIIKNAHHSLNVECPDVFNQKVIAYLS